MGAGGDSAQLQLRAAAPPAPREKASVRWSCRVQLRQLPSVISYLPSGCEGRGMLRSAGIQYRVGVVDVNKHLVRPINIFKQTDRPINPAHRDMADVPRHGRTR